MAGPRNEFAGAAEGGGKTLEHCRVHTGGGQKKAQERYFNEGWLPLLGNNGGFLPLPYV